MAAVVQVAEGAVSVVAYQVGDFTGRRLRFSAPEICCVVDDVCGGMKVPNRCNTVIGCWASTAMDGRWVVALMPPLLSYSESSCLFNYLLHVIEYAQVC